MRKCYKCNASNNLIRVAELCGSCEEFETGVAWFHNHERGVSDEAKEHCCTCKSICRDCQQNKCSSCGNVNRRDKRVAASCKICGRVNMLERVDGSDTDGRGNWVDGQGQVVGSYRKCVDCGMKTVCINCATEMNAQQEIPPKSLSWY